MLAAWKSSAVLLGFGLPTVAAGVVIAGFLHITKQLDHTNQLLAAILERLDTGAEVGQ